MGPGAVSVRARRAAPSFRTAPRHHQHRGSRIGEEDLHLRGELDEAAESLTVRLPMDEETHEEGGAEQAEEDLQPRARPHDEHERRKYELAQQVDRLKVPALARVASDEERNPLHTRVDAAVVAPRGQPEANGRADYVGDDADDAERGNVAPASRMAFYRGVARHEALLAQLDAVEGLERCVAERRVQKEKGPRAESPERLGVELVRERAAARPQVDAESVHADVDADADERQQEVEQETLKVRERCGGDAVVRQQVEAQVELDAAEEAVEEAGPLHEVQLVERTHDLQVAHENLAQGAQVGQQVLRQVLGQLLPEPR